MTDENRFFRFLWRFNAIALALAAIVVVAFGATMAVIVSKEALTRRSNNVLNLDQQDGSVEAETHLGDPKSVVGEVVSIPLLRKQRYNLGIKSKSGVNTVNILFLDARTGSGRWLLPDNNALILEQDWITETDEQGGYKTRAVVYSIVRSDTSGDGFLSASDGMDIAIGSLDGAVFKVVIPNVVSHTWSTYGDNGRGLIFFEDDAGHKLAQVILDTFEVISVVDLPAMPE